MFGPQPGALDDTERAARDNDELIEWLEAFDTIPLDELETTIAAQCENCGRKHYSAQACPSCGWRLL